MFNDTGFYSNKIPTTFEAQYVSRTVGPAIAKGLAEIIERRPADPVEYLANYLHKYVANKKQHEKDLENEVLVNKLRKEKEIEDKRMEEMRRETEALKVYEEELRKEKEVEERRKRELEELAKRKEEVANLAPALPSLAEEEDQIVEFGETKLHQLASVAGSNLTPLLRDSHNIAARNSKYKTPRDIALELNLSENVRQIDEFIWELVAQENYKQLTDLIVLGFNELSTIIEAKYGNADQMREKGLKTQADQIYTVLPQVQAKIKELKKFIETNDLNGLKANMDKKWLVCYRDAQGKSSLHVAIEKNFFEVALYLLEKCPLLSKLNDCADRYPIDLLKQVDAFSLEEADAALYEQLNQRLN